MMELERRPLADTGVRIPRVALGCGNFGGIGSAPELFGQGLDQDAAFAVMDAGWELGIDHFDTADAYGGGASETMIGAWMRARGVRPGLTTKTFNPMRAGADHGLAPERIERQLAGSLERLGVDRVDLYLAHEYDPRVPVIDTFGAFEAAVHAGTVRAYGVSNWDAQQLAEGLRAGGPVAIQNGHSLLHRDDEAAVLPLCQRRDIAYMAFSPLAGGWLTGKYRRGQPFPPGSRMTQRPDPYQGLVTDATFDLLERLEAAAAQRGISPAGLALSWLLADERVAQIVVGPGRPQHLEPVREALAHPVSAGEREALAVPA